MNKQQSLQNLLSAIFLVNFFLFVPVLHAQHSQSDWQEGLEKMKNDLSQGIDGFEQLKLVDYTYKGAIRSDEEKTQIIDAMYADNAPMSVVLSTDRVQNTTITDTDTIIEQKYFPKFEITTVRRALDTGKLSADSISAIKQILQKNISLGTDCLELVWNYKGEEYRTMAIVDAGVPFDLITVGLRTGGSTTVKGITSKNK